MIQCVVFAVGPLPLTSFSRPPHIHLMSLMWWMRPGLPCFHALPLPCIILNTNQRTKNRGGLGTRLTFHHYRSVPQIRPPFCNLSLSTKRRGGLYVGCDNFSHDYAPPSSTDKAWPHCRWGIRAKCEVSPSVTRKDAPDATGRLKSFNVEGQGSRALPRSSWRVHRWCGRFTFAVDTLTVDSWVA